MRLSERLRVSACMAALLGMGLCTWMSGALAQPAGYVIVNSSGDNARGAKISSDRGEPETFSSIQEIPDASVVPAVGSEGPAEPAAHAAPEPAKHIRVVGPKFFPDPEEALDLRAPGRTHAR